MKKQIIPNLGRIIGKAVIVAAMACPILFSSCAKFIFDDSELKESIADLDKRLTELEQKMQGQINTLTTLINGMTTVSKIETNGGKTIITLSDGQTVTVYPESDLSGLSFLTVKEENGVYYWAVGVYGKEPEFLLIDGNNVPVIPEETKFEITSKTEDGKYYISIDGGKTWIETGAKPQDVKLTQKIEDGKYYISIDGGQSWIATGVEAKDITLKSKLEDGVFYVSIDGGVTWEKTGIEPEEDVIVFTSYDQDEDYVYLTLADGTVIKVAKEKEVAFAILSGKQYFTYGQTKSLKLEMNGVKDYTITEKPDGWKASISGSNLSITAPKEEADADSEGTIKILATFEDANPVIAKVDVSVAEPDFTLILDGTDVKFILAAKNVGSYEYGGYVYGILPQSQYSAEAAIEYFNMEYRYGGQMTEDYSTTIEALAGETYDATESYVIFASNWYSPYGEETYSSAEIQYAVYIPVVIDVEITPAFDNANVRMTFSGCDGYYAGCTLKKYWDPEDELYGLGESYGAPLCTDNYDGPAGLFGGGWNNSLNIGAEYVVWVVPFDESGVYTVDSFKTWEFSTYALAEGASLPAPVVAIKEVALDKVIANVSAVDGAYKTYASIFEKSSLPETDLDIVKKVIYGNSSVTGDFEVKKTYLNPGTEVIVVAVAIANDGKFGAITKIEEKTKSLEFSETFKVSIESVKVGMTNASIKLAFEGGTPATLRYVNTNSIYGLDNIESQLAMNSRYDIISVDYSTLTDNTVELDDLNISEEYSFFILALDADGNLTHMAKTTYTPTSDIVYVKKSDDNWAFGKPSFSNEVWTGGWTKFGDTWYPTFAELTIDLSMPEDCKQVYILADDPDYYTSTSAMSMSDIVVAKGTVYETSQSIYFDTIFSATHLYMVWIDSNDKYHIYDEYTPKFPAKPAE